jgi:hypothetical protein
MAKALFKLESIHKIGHLAEDFDALLTQAVRDCKERPAMAKPREIKLTVRVIPSKQSADDVEVHSVVTGKTPAREALPYLMQTTINNGLKFAPNSPMEPDQGELPFDEE